ncbi:MAG TPA: cytochrome oxidase small assembly protein [Noviherbaspirillum sp.]
MPDQKKPDNLKTALILLSVALMFFIGIFVKRIWFN